MNTVIKVCTLFGITLLLGMIVVLTMSATACATPPGNLAKGFPQLDRQFKVIDRADQDYNCIARTLGLRDQWIDPQTGPANAPFSLMDQLYGKHGYQRTATMDLRPNPRLERVALYAKVAPDGTIQQITHPALQEPGGSWTSKLGRLPLIRHASPFAVDGPMYGVPVATYVRDSGNGGANQVMTGLASNQGSFQNGLAHAKNARMQNSASKNNSFAGAGNRAGNNFAGNAGISEPLANNSNFRNAAGAGNGAASNFSRGFHNHGSDVASAALRINGGIHVRGPSAAVDVMDFLRTAASNRDGAATGAIVINGGIHIRGSFGKAFHHAGRCLGGDGNFGQGADNYSGGFNNRGGVKTGLVANNASILTNPGNAKNAGNSLNALTANQSFTKNNRGGSQNGGNAKNAGNSLNSLTANRGFATNSKNGPQNAGKSLNALVSNGYAKNAGTTPNAGNRLAGNNRIGCMPGNIRVNITGNDNNVSINLGTSKAAKNAPAVANVKNFASPQNRSYLAKNTENTGGLAKNVGNAKYAGNTGGPAMNVGNARNAGNARNTLTGNGAKNSSNLTRAQNTGNACNRIGSLPSKTLVNLNSNHNKVAINVGAAKPSNTAGPSRANAKNGPVNNLLAKNTGNPQRPTANVGNAKNTGITAGLAQNVGNTKNAGNARKMVVCDGDFKYTSNPARAQNAKNGPGALVGNKAAGNKTNASPVNTKNGPGTLVGNKAAGNKTNAKNTGPVVNAKTGAPKQGLGNMAGAKPASNQIVFKNTPVAAKTNTPKQGVSAKPAVQSRPAPAVATSAPAQPIAQRPANTKSAQANTPKLAQTKTNQAASNAGAKNVPAIAKSLPPRQTQATSTPNRGRVGNAANLARTAPATTPAGRRK